MKFIKEFTGIIMLSASIVGYAGVLAPTAHSRANCAGFNESITWHLGYSYW